MGAPHVLFAAWIRRHPLRAYVLLAGALSWNYWLALLALGWRVAPGSDATHLPGLAGPAVAALLVTACAEGEAGWRALWQRCRRWPSPPGRTLVLALSPLIAGAAVFAARALVTGQLPAWAQFKAYPGLPADGSWPAVVLVALLLNGFGEELGWRGFLLRRLAASQGPRRAALIVAGVWALWHLPLFWLHAGMAAMVGPMLLGWAGGLVAGSLLLGWLFLATDSVLVVAVWHTAFNFMVATPPGHGAVAIVLNAAVVVAAVRVWRAWPR
ncbi:CPBP family intramembrane glutamic endopeptidase [Roseateles cellulosilyticus]|uniref:CPBP family intramembrane metalloprotease n=1 Tax=Pelomonas cellulosilytica TaxID=2906762 RepID=A0ABS8XNZ2_9BURK|nr:CPBP family intramembrane glutamic endopeptidase [Pelomonas sp. P8]MCE4554479.1 CPBP family intramembrane metalloprotease [Pelomonas sp. P8]